MAAYYIKSPRGRQVLRERSAALPRSARNLLLILDASRPVDRWIEMVRGAGWADVAALVDAGLIEPVRTVGLPDTRPASIPADLHSGFHTDFLQSRMMAADGEDDGDLAVAAPPRRAVARAPAAPVVRPAPPAWRPTAPQPLAAMPAPVSAPAPALDSVFVPLDGTPDLPDSTLAYAELYDSLNALARQTLGLFRGYRYTLRIERARDTAELQAVAHDFLREVRRLRGESVARVVQRALGIDAREA